jgi:hypothetical protein
MKAFEHTAFIKLDSNGDLFTKHGFHMNKKGKIPAKKEIVATIKNMLINKRTDSHNLKRSC